jgi:hypothetical protein
MILTNGEEKESIIHTYLLGLYQTLHSESLKKNSKEKRA